MTKYKYKLHKWKDVEVDHLHMNDDNVVVKTEKFNLNKLEKEIKYLKDKIDAYENFSFNEVNEDVKRVVDGCMRPLRHQYHDRSKWLKRIKKEKEKQDGNK